VQGVGFQRFEQDSAVGVDDAFGYAGGAGAVEDPQRMLERHLLVARRRVAGDRLGEVGDAHGQRGDRVEVAHHDGVPHRRQPAAQLVDQRAAVHRFARETVAVDADQYGRLDLPEPVDQPVEPEIRCAAGPHGPDAGAGQHRNDGWGDVG
jgi:hypothetical protein